MSDPLNAAVTKKSVDTGVGLIQKLYKKGKAKLNKRVVTKGAKRYFERVTEICEIKTIWQTDADIDLRNFYVPLRVSVKGENGTQATNLECLPPEQCILIEGVAGQGKSILLRYLCAKEFECAKSFPVFIELRKLEGFPIIEKICEEVRLVDSTLSDEVVYNLLEDGFITLFLDGFDELTEAHYNVVLNEIDVISRKYGNVRVLVSSRPDYPIQFAQKFVKCRISDLNNAERNQLIRNVTVDANQSVNICDILMSREHSQSLRGLLTTPLATILLVITYRAEQQVPSSVGEFYKKLFDVMMRGHDGAKPGFSRPRATSLSDNNMLIGFQTFCYYSKSHDFPIARSVAIECSNKSIELCKFDTCSEGFFDDIVKVTCLILKDGLDYSFVHKSIQEFFTANFIGNLNDVRSKKFYSAMLKSVIKQNWHAELNYLAELDEYRFKKYFLEAQYLKALDLKNSNELENLKIKSTYDYLSRFSNLLEVMYTGGNTTRLMVSWSILLRDDARLQMDECFEQMKKVDFSSLRSRRGEKKVNQDTGTTDWFLNGTDLLKIPETRKITKTMLLLIVKYSYEMLKGLKVDLENQEDENVLDLEIIS